MRLSPEEYQIVREIVRKHVPADVDVFVFGSRATGRRVKPFSDLDLCLRGSAAVSEEALTALRLAFVESQLPFKADVIDWHATEPSFRELIVGDFERLNTGATP